MILIFILTLLSLVVIHELGHFLVAKRFKIKVEEFGFGIPPKAWGKKVGETLVSINWLPFGGFVRLLGEDETDKKILKNPRSFAAQSVGKRIAVVVAGVVMNLLVAWIIYYLILASQGFKYQMPLIFPHQFVGVEQSQEQIILISAVSDNSPAFHAGIKKGDRVVALNDSQVTDAKAFSTEVKQFAGKEISVTLTDEKKNNPRVVNLTPRKDPPAGQGALGVSFSNFTSALLEYKTPLQKIFAGPIHSFNIAAVSFETLGKLIGLSVTNRNIGYVSEGVGGPIAIGYYSNIILQSPNALMQYLDIVAGISLSLALFNFLPIPALDGGRLFFLYIEALFKKRVSADIEKNVHAVGMVILLLLMLLITFKDFNTYIVPEITKILPIL